MLKICALLLSIVCVCSCSSFKDRTNLNNGIYRSEGKKYYIDRQEDKITIFPVLNRCVDSQSGVNLPERLNAGDSILQRRSFRQASFDIDVLSIPFKYRPSIKAFPNQMNTNFNGAAYFGLRQDHYIVRYLKDPLCISSRKIQHIGYSLGFLSGIGSTAMNPWVTRYAIDSEYDGVVWSNGVALILGVSQFSFGAVLGFDKLLDSNKNVWIYHNKHWIGLGIALNLN